MPEIMTPRHPGWPLFLSKLDEDCDNTLSLARKVLERDFPGIDVEGSVTFFEMNSGYCTCEILMNIEWRDEKLLNYSRCTKCHMNHLGTLYGDAPAHNPGCEACKEFEMIETKASTLVFQRLKTR